MSLADIASIASILSSIAVAVSLIYLGVQAHQNAKHTKALIQSARVDRLMTQMVGFSDADKCAAYIAGNGGEPTPQAIQERQFFMQCLAQTGVMLDVFTQHRAGLLSNEQFNGVCGTYRVWLKEPGFRKFTLERNLAFRQSTPEFAVFVDSLMADASAPPLMRDAGGAAEDGANGEVRDETANAGKP